MKSIVKRAGLLAAASIVFFGGSARADTMEIHVPFAFVVRGQTLPAGEYRVENDGGVILIRGEKGNKTSMFVFTNPANGHDVVGDRPSLVFKGHETQYRLAEIWESGSQGFAIASR